MRSLAEERQTRLEISGTGNKGTVNKPWTGSDLQQYDS